LPAVKELQDYLETQQDWEHNFGLKSGKEGPIIGKMFGILVVETKAGELGYLAAFSGKLAGSNNHSKFVPPIYDALLENGFLNKGMEKLNTINSTIKLETDSQKIEDLKELRKKHSVQLQEKLFEQYHFLNQAGERKNVKTIFREYAQQKPPAAAGECAAPKLLQYAFEYDLKPLAFTEFWWGKSPKSKRWKHKQFYAPCTEKCKPILSHMLLGYNTGL